MDKVRWITVWILAGETAANSLIRNLGSEGRETLSCESESEREGSVSSEKADGEGVVCFHLLIEFIKQAYF